MKQHSLILLCVLAFLMGATTQSLEAQQRLLVRGKVISNADKLPLPMAHVFEVDADGRILSTAVSDIDGNYSLLVASKENKLSSKYVGFKTKFIPIDGKSVVDIYLDEETIALQDAVVTASRVVTAGMMNIPERELTSSMVRLDTKDIAELSAASIDDAIQGRMAGVDVVASSGDPGAGMSIRIRGTTSINGSSEPLVVVDGVIYETTIGDFDFANATEQEYSQLLNIATEDIAEISVLKDAAATAIYGSKAANGVLQITTKRGNVGPPRVSYTYKGNIAKQPDPLPMLTGDQYTTLIIEQQLNAGIQMDMTSNPEFAYDTNNPYYYYNYGQNTNWIKEITQTGKTNDHSVSISGGTSKVRYRFSAGYWNQEGTTIGTDYSRISTRMNIDYNVSDKLRFSADVSYTHGDNHRNYVTSIRSRSYTKMPNQSVFEFTETGLPTSVYFTPQTNQQGTYSGNYNPVALAKEGQYRILSEKIIPKLQVQYRISPTWRYVLDVSFSVGNNKNNSFLPRVATGLDLASIYVNKSDESDSESFSTQTYNKLLWQPKLGEDYTLQVLLGTNTYSSEGRSYSAATSSSASSFLQDPISGYLSNSSSSSISSGSSQYRNMAVFAQFQYGMFDRYFLNGTMRRDGSSKFGNNYRYGDFPSISARWRASSEPFLRGTSKWLTDLSVRASYGINGNEPNASYLQYSRYSTYGYAYLGTSGTSASNMQLANLRWERSTQANIAGNLILFSGRINVDYDYYMKSTNDLLFNNLTLPSSSGFGNVGSMNVGKMDNIGWELNVQTTPVRSKDWTVNLNFNVSRSENFIRELSEYISTESGNWNANGSYLTRYIMDQPLGSFYGYRYKGVYLNEEQTIATDKSGNAIYTYDENNQYVPLYMKFGAGTATEYQFEAGDARYEDINNDGSIDEQDIVYIGDANPDFFGGFGPSVTWKRRWTLSAHFNFRYGNDVINGAKMSMESMYNYNNQSTAVLRRFRHSYETAEEVQAAPKDLLPRALHGTGYNWLGSDRFVEDGSFIRFRSLTLKYSFNPDKLRAYHLNGLSMWFTAQNLFVWTNYSGQDPEVSIGGLNIGRDGALAPRQKDYNLGVTVQF